MKPIKSFSRQLIVILVFIILITACSSTSETATEAVVKPEAPKTEMPVTSAQHTPTPSWMDGAIIIASPVPTPPDITIWKTPTPVALGAIELFLTGQQSYILCPEETIKLFEDGIQVSCPGEDLNGNQVLASFAPAFGVSQFDSPMIGPADAAAVLLVIGTGTALVLNKMPRILMARNPNTLPDVNIPDGVPAFPDHLVNHPRGPFTGKLKQLAWIEMFSAWAQAINGGPDPDWCGVRPSDGALMIVYYGAKVVTLTGRAYEGIAMIVNMGADTHDSTIFTKLKPPAEGQGHTTDPTGRSENAFNQFTFIDPSNCPGPPGVVAR